jgi:ABC-type cobalamin/Fe3+-siderophores transport system ATPase subunit
MSNKIVISGFLNYKTITVPLKENKVIIVGENGIGKTTLLKIIFLFLAKQWHQLLDSPIEAIDWHNEECIISYKKKTPTNQEIIQLKDVFKKKYPTYQEFIETFFSNDISRIREYSAKPFLTKSFEIERDLPVALLRELVDMSTKLFYDVGDFSNLNVLYMPTFRRIESGISDVFPDLDARLQLFLEENISFKHNKVEDKEEFENNEEGFKKEDLLTDLKLILPENIMSKIWKERIEDRFFDGTKQQNELVMLAEFGMEDVRGRLLKTIRKRNELLREQPLESEKIDLKLKSFREVCLKYLGENSSIEWDNNDFIILKTVNQNKLQLTLEQLSSGEKQMIALFSYLYLPIQQPWILIIDEPELSLSIRWQEMVLHDIMEGNCQTLIVATHSPFIINESLHSNTLGFKELIEQ